MTGTDTEKTIIAVPVADGRLCSHFGHCQQFAFYYVDVGQRRIEDSRRLDPPPHEPGLFPQWLSEQSAQVVIAGGIGRRARSAFEDHGIRAIAGAPSGDPHEIVQAYLDGHLVTEKNPCDH